MHAEKLLETFASSVGLGHMAFDQEGLCAIAVDDDHHIAIRKEESEYITLLGIITTEIPVKLPLTMQKALLIAAINPLNGIAPGLGMEPQTEHLLLYWTMSISTMELGQFNQTLSTFIENLQHWKKQLNPVVLEQLMHGKQGDFRHSHLA